jgi:hypothetical protein
MCLKEEVVRNRFDTCVTFEGETSQQTSPKAPLITQTNTVQAATDTAKGTAEYAKDKAGSAAQYAADTANSAAEKAKQARVRV